MGLSIADIKKTRTERMEAAKKSKETGLYGIVVVG